MKTTTTKREAKWAEMMAGARFCLEVARAHEAKGEMAEARMCADLAHDYHQKARRYEE